MISRITNINNNDRPNNIVQFLFEDTTVSSCLACFVHKRVSGSPMPYCEPSPESVLHLKNCSRPTRQEFKPLYHAVLWQTGS